METFVWKQLTALSCSLYSQKAPSWQGPEYASEEAAIWEVYWKIDVLKFAVKILEKYLWRSSFLVKLQADSLQLSVALPEIFT